MLGALRRFLAGRICHPWSILPISIGNAPAPVRQRDHQLGKAVEQAAIVSKGLPRMLFRCKGRKRFAADGRDRMQVRQIELARYRSSSSRAQ